MALLAELRYPADDVRAQIGEVALDVARAMDAGDIYTEGGVHPPKWYLDYALHDVTFDPNRPANQLEEIRYRHISRAWEERQFFVTRNGGPGRRNVTP